MEDTNFYCESKASFIDISSIVSFKLFLIASLQEMYTFLDSSMVSLKSSPWPRYTQLGTKKKKNNHFPLSNVFSYSNMFSVRLFLANTQGKKSGVTMLV